jgi:hypothetical protein
MNERLYIDGNLIDTDQKGLDVAISYSIEGIVPGKIQGAHSSRLVKIPATKKVRRIFENIEMPGASTTRAYQYLPARLESSGLPILEGKARVDEVELRATPTGFEPETYKVALLGTNADWFTDVGNTLVRALGWGNLVISVPTVEASVDPATGESCFILMKWQEWTDVDKVRHEEFTPAVFVWRILQKAFQAYGYELVSVFDSDPLNRLIIPFGLALDPEFFQNQVNMRASTASPSSITRSDITGEFKISFTDETTAPNFDNGDNYASGVYTAPITALYDLIAEMNFNLVATSNDPGQPTTLILEWRINGAPQAIYLFVADDYDWNMSLVFNDSVIFEFIADLNEGDTVELYLRYDNVNNLVVNSIDGVQTIEAEKESFELGEVYALADVIPGTWFVRDIIKDLTFIFNLAWETDVLARKVYAYPKDDYYLKYRPNATGTTTATAFPGFFKNQDQYDLIARGVKDNEVKIIDNYKSTTVLAWSTDDDTTEAEEKRRGVNIYSGGYEFPQDRYPNGIDTQYTGFFAKTLHINDTDITSGGMLGVQIPLLFGENYNETDVATPNYNLAPRLLYYAGRRAGNDGYVRLYYSATSATSAFDYPAAFMVNYAAPSGVDFSLSFSDEVTNYGNATPGLFTSLYLQEFKRREIGKLYTASAKYSRSDVSALTFREKPRIGGANFILQELTFKPSSNAPSKVLLMYDERPTADDVAKVINTAALAGASPAPGTVTGSGSGLVGSTTTTINVYASNNLYQNHTGFAIVLPANSGITAVSNTDAQVFVFQNGQKIWPGVQYTISGSTITIDAGTHFDGANYEVIVNGVRKG